jgi:uncharacterized Fe-S cluster-containing radical SAM superfamily enzyme
MVIDPQGYITLCCLMEGKKRIFNKHISQVDNIINFFNGKQYNDIRIEFEEKTFKNISECHFCKKTIDNGRFCPAIASQQFDPSINKLQYLEFNTSNVCNQQCVTCSSKFSNQWIKINPLFDRYDDTTYILTDKDINKICDALTDLKELQIKGGEPFADIRNYKIIKKLFEVNDECMIQIITNGSLISEKYMDLIFRNPKRFWISASIDAVGKRYEWIRGTPWEKTNQTLKELYYQTGVKPTITPILSSYNINSTTSLDNWASESEWIDIEATKSIGGYYKNLVHGPDWCNPKKVFTQKQINTIKDLPFPIKSEYNKHTFERHIKYTEVMNKVRGFEIDIWNDME